MQKDSNLTCSVCGTGRLSDKAARQAAWHTSYHLGLRAGLCSVAPLRTLPGTVSHRGSDPPSHVALLLWPVLSDGMRIGCPSCYATSSQPGKMSP